MKVLVSNTGGPFYKHAAPVIEAALRARIDYIDINDDHDVVEKLLLDLSTGQRTRSLL